MEADMDMDALRRQLADLVDGVGAHMPFEEAVADFPEDGMNRRPPNVAPPAPAKANSGACCGAESRASACCRARCSLNAVPALSPAVPRSR